MSMLYDIWLRNYPQPDINVTKRNFMPKHLQSSLGDRIMFDIERAMDKIFAEVSKRIKDNQYTDDWCWGEDWNGRYCIRFEVIEAIVDENGKNIVDIYGRPVERSRGVYTFYYRQDEEHYDDVDKAIMEWINDRF